MDILISSNLERLLYFAAGPERTAAYMNSLNKDGVYSVDTDVKAAIDASFKGYFADEAKTAETIRTTMSKYQYLADTHTAVAISAAEQYMAETGDVKPMVIASTASPYKFAADVYESLYSERPSDPLDALEDLSAKTATEIPYPLRGIKDRSVRFTDVVDSADMWKAVINYVEQ